MPGIELLIGFLWVIFVLIFLSTCFYLIERVVFWEPLAKHYRATQEPVGKAWLGKIGQINFWQSSLEFMTDATGIYMEKGSFFWLEYPRIFIPWQEFHNPMLCDIWISRHHSEPGVEVQVGIPRKATMKLPLVVFQETAGRKILEQSPIGTNVPTS